MECKRCMRECESRGFGGCEHCEHLKRESNKDYWKRMGLEDDN